MKTGDSLVRFRQQNYLVRFRTSSWFGLKFHKVNHMLESLKYLICARVQMALLATDTWVLVSAMLYTSGCE